MPLLKNFGSATPNSLCLPTIPKLLVSKLEFEIPYCLRSVCFSFFLLSFLLCLLPFLLLAPIVPLAPRSDRTRKPRSNVCVIKFLFLASTYDFFFFSKGKRARLSKDVAGNSDDEEIAAFLDDAIPTVVITDSGSSASPSPVDDVSGNLAMDVDTGSLSSPFLSFFY